MAETIPDFPYTKVDRCPDFTHEELSEALCKGKMGKAVGTDKVPDELLVKIGSTTDGAGKILTWFNRLLHGEEPLPDDWLRASMVLLPKIAEPVKPSQVRPICIGQAACKVYCRMLLERTKSALKYEGCSQSMGSGRQTTDYVFCVARLMQLEQEWKCGAVYLKLDIQKAFDT